MYCIVDLETTGGSATKSKITEIAIYKTDGKKIIDSYTSLLNPKRPIPAHISRLTGITDGMVTTAPVFQEIAAEIDQFTMDTVFVAHNVNFDYGFLKNEFQRIGIHWRRKKLCTVRLSRQLLKGKQSYSLGNLCRELDIPLSNRHRAFGDAQATTILFHTLLENDKKGVIENSLKPQSLEALIPPNLQKSEFLALPEMQGLYYFKDAKSKIIYIGQAKNIKQRIHSHFSGNSNTKSKYYFIEQIHAIDYKLISSSMLLDLEEAIEIKKHWPRHNRAMKRYSLNYGIFNYIDQNEYSRFAIGKCGKYEKPIASFRYREDALAKLKEMVVKHKLCPRLSGLQPISSGACNYIEEIECDGACQGNESFKSYNKRTKEAVKALIKPKSSFLVEQINENIKSIVLIEKGRLRGYAKVDPKKKFNKIEDAKRVLSSTYDDQDLRTIIQKHIYKAEKTDSIVYFD